MESYSTFSVLVWLPSLSIVIVRFIHVVSIIHSFFCWVVNFCTIYYSLFLFSIYYNFFIHLIDIWVISNFWELQICYEHLHIFIWTCVIMYLTFLRNWKMVFQSDWTILFSWEQCIRVLALRILRIEVLEFDEV